MAAFPHCAFPRAEGEHPPTRLHEELSDVQEHPSRRWSLPIQLGWWFLRGPWGGIWQSHGMLPDSLPPSEVFVFAGLKGPVV